MSSSETSGVQPAPLSAWTTAAYFIAGNLPVDPPNACYIATATAAAAGHPHLVRSYEIELPAEL